ncbi:MAG: aminopeptidase N [Gammaproteobacteria bacterium]|nr:aminopeptidase N [Gammaproteobacteria bacterium]
MTTTTYLKDYQPSSFTVVTVSLTFDLFEDHALVRNEMHLKRQHPGELRLYGDDLTPEEVWQDDQALTAEQYQLDGSDLIITTAPDEFQLTVVTRILPQDNTELSGLYRSKTMFCTQCEAEGFRRITFFPDRPDVLAVYTTKIIADQTAYPVLLSNGDLLESGTLENNRHWVIWHDPFPKPSYLFALVAGNLACCRDEFITCSDKKVALHLYVEPGNEAFCSHALVSLKHAMRWDEERFGREYDLSIFMIVAVGDFNMGAMENKGLNIFNSKFILAQPDTATDEDFAGIESVVAHEYFHNWTGNRVTCRDWFQLSLKEGLTVFRDQEFSRDMNSREVNRIKDVKVLRNIQFPEDAGSMVHPVQPSEYQEISNFYTATVYNKGAEVIRMQYELLGEALFRQGMDLYFERHDGQAVTIDDFVAAMADASGKDLSQFKRWYHQAGTPVVTIVSHYDAGRLTLNCKQDCPPTPETKEKQPFHIPIQMALFDSSGQFLQEALLELRETEQVFHFEDLKAEPIVSLLRDFSAPIILKTSATEEQLLGLLRFETNGFAKWDTVQRLIRDAIILRYQGDDQQADTRAAKLFPVLGEILEQEQLDPALRAELLTIPSFEDLASAETLVDVTRLEQIRLDFMQSLAEALSPKLKQCFEMETARADDAVHGIAIGRRKLRLQCLRLLLKADESAWLDHCDTLLRSSKLMTEQMVGFVGLAHSQDAAARQQACDLFYQQWSQDALVLDKWFTVQATADVDGVLDNVRGLLAHQDFNYRNPNRVRALLSAFVTANPKHFHAADGSGYQLLTDQLLILDPLNAQISARLAVPLTRWQRLDKPRQALIQAQLQRLASQQLSKDLAELVMRSQQDLL